MIASADLLDLPERARLSVEDYVLLAESGALDAFARSELIDGDIYVMNAQFSPHARAHSRLLRAIGNGLADLGSDCEALVEVAVHAAADSMPEPDIVVTRWRGEGAVPPDSIVLIVEVSQTTRHIDLGRKAAIYSAAGVPEYWVVDLARSRVRRHTIPGPANYGSVTDVPFGSAIEASTVPGLRIDTGVLD